MDGACVQVVDEDGKKRIHRFPGGRAGAAILKGLLTLLLFFCWPGRKKGDLQLAPPPHDAVLAILADPRGLPKLAEISNIPILRADGSLIDRPGYDPATGLIYDPFDLGALGVPEHPTRDEVNQAVEVIKRPFAGFSFTTGADRANFIAVLLSVICRLLIQGNIPLFLFDSPVQGSGKTTLATSSDIIATGALGGLMTAPERGGDDEVRKRLTATLLTNPPVAIFDNVVGSLTSPALAALLTAGVWRDRRLGASEMVTIPVRAVLCVTGVNIGVQDDLARRSVWVRLDPATDKPWERQFDFSLNDYLMQNRREIVAALLTLARFWVAQGRPAWGGKAFGSFEHWAETVGGILQAAGIEGFLGNRGVADDAANREIEALAGFLEAWDEAFKGVPKRAAEVARVLSEECKESSEGIALRAGLLEEMLPILDHREGRAATRVSNVLRKYKGRLAGGLKLVEEFDRHRKVALWTVVRADADTEGTEGGTAPEPVGDGPSPYRPPTAPSCPPPSPQFPWSPPVSSVPTVPPPPPTAGVPSPVSPTLEAPLADQYQSDLFREFGTAGFVE